MRCREHRSDASSSVGVCATCLRERMAAHLAAQQHQVQMLLQQPPPPVFPRSVSPYVARRKSQCEDDDWSPSQLFFHTPQATCHPSSSKPLPKKRFFHFTMFRSRSDISDPHPHRVSASWSKIPASILSRGRRREQVSSPTRASGADVESSSLAFCLSPLVWTSPQYTANQGKHRKNGATDIGSVENRRLKMSPAVSFFPNRTRKMPDVGRR